MFLPESSWLSRTLRAVSRSWLTAHFTRPGWAHPGPWAWFVCTPLVTHPMLLKQTSSFGLTSCSYRARDYPELVLFFVARSSFWVAIRAYTGPFLSKLII